MEAFRAPTKDNILQLHISEDDFRLSNDSDNMLSMYNITKKIQSAQPVILEFKLDGIVPANIYGYDLVLTNRWLSITSDGQRMFIITYFFNDSIIFFHCYFCLLLNNASLYHIFLLNCLFSNLVLYHYLFLSFYTIYETN